MQIDALDYPPNGPQPALGCMGGVRESPRWYSIGTHAAIGWTTGTCLLGKADIANSGDTRRARPQPNPLRMSKRHQCIFSILFYLNPSSWSEDTECRAS